MARMTTPVCDSCGGSHENVPTERSEHRNGELGAYCPHCGTWGGLGESDPSDIDRHPAVPLDDPVLLLCSHCNAGFEIDV